MSLKPLNVCCNRIYKAIPLAFDESLSYLEMLGAICKELNETIEQVNANTEWINNYSGDLDDIQNRLTIAEQNINTLTTNVNKNTQDINDLRNYTINLISGLRNELIEIINGNYNSLKNYVDMQDADLQYQIDNINIGATIIYDPTTGLQSPVQTVINNLYQLSNKDGITAGEFDTLELTCNQFEAYDMTAYEFDSQSKTILTQ